jgi:hypothetical protein
MEVKKRVSFIWIFIYCLAYVVSAPNGKKHSHSPARVVPYGNNFTKLVGVLGLGWRGFDLARN